MCPRSVVAGLLGCLVHVSIAAAAAPAPPCSEPGVGWCLARRIAGEVPEGELGFRFGEPLDVDGDGTADVAAGSRFAMRQTYQAGRAAVWSGASGALIRAWDWEPRDALFGHWVLPIPDVDDDALADLVIAAPLAVTEHGRRGVVVARSPKTGAEIWRRSGAADGTLGWDLALAGDHDGDGREDLFVGEPATSGGRVHLLSGKTGTVLRDYAPRARTSSFGWFVARLDDLDGDGHADLAVGAPAGRNDGDPPNGAAYVFSSGTGKELRHWEGTRSPRKFGEVVATVGDLDGDGHGDVAVAGTDDETRQHPAEVRVFSAVTGAELRRWPGPRAGELYGRMVAAAGDLDGDGVDDLAIAAPWYRSAVGDKVGRAELRSGKTGRVLSELVGEAAESWFGWHIRRAPDPEGRGRPALLIGSLRQSVGGAGGVGVIDLYVLRRPKTASDQGTISRDARRSDIK
jgi:hypothetical protein